MIIKAEVEPKRKVLSDTHWSQLASLTQILLFSHFLDKQTLSKAAVILMFNILSDATKVQRFDGAEVEVVAVSGRCLWILKVRLFDVSVCGLGIDPDVYCRDLRHRSVAVCTVYKRQVCGFS